MWARMSTSELVERSEIVLYGELIGHTKIALQHGQGKLFLGVLQVEEILKGDKNQTVILLVLPSKNGLVRSTDIFYKKGQKGLWFLRVRAGEEGVYLADHPQRFMPSGVAAKHLEEIRKIIKNKES